MKTRKTSYLFATLIISALTIVGCSSDEAEAPKTSAAPTSKKAVHRVDTGEATEPEKRQFEKEFSAKCVERELKNSVNKDVDEKRFQESCDCIAEHIMKDLSEIDAEKYLEDHEDTQTLGIKFDAAAYFCLQSKPQPKGPQLFGKPQ
jgi:hypothetical protein